MRQLKLLLVKFFITVAVVAIGAILIGEIKYTPKPISEEPKKEQPAYPEYIIRPTQEA